MTENEDDIPDGKAKNVTDPSANILEDSFFDSLSEIEDGIGKVDFTKLGEDGVDSLKDIFNTPKPKPKEEKKEEDSKKMSSFSPLPTSPVKPVKENKESTMNNKKQLESLGFDSEEDPTANQFKEIWEHMNAPDTSEYRLMVFRMEPQMIKGVKISGFLEAFHLPITIPAIIEQVGQKYGGGKFQIRIVDGTGKYVKSKMFEISGFPKLPMPEELNKAKPEESQETNKHHHEQETEQDEGNELDDEFDFDPTPKRRIKPIGSRYSSFRRDRFQDEDPFPPLYDHQPLRPSFRREEPKEDFGKTARDLEDKILNKVESKFDKLIDTLKGSEKKSDSMFNPDVVKAFAPVVVSWLESKGSKDVAAAGQFGEVNKQVVGLVQGMQDLVRMTDKTKEDFAEKERREREANRSQLLEHQQKMEERFLKQQQMADERHQKMLLEMKGAFENKQSQSASTEANLRLEYEKMREDFRLREEKQREETRSREERLRDEQRARDEDTRRREDERREQQRKDEERWREELHRRDEEARKREAAFQDALRQREIDSIKESKNRESEIMDRFRGLEQQKVDMQTKLLEQVYSTNINNRENQLQMDLAIAKLNSETEAKMLQAKAQMELEKLRHQTQMHMSKVKHDLDTFENRKDSDPLDAAMQDYLKRRLQIDMIKELNMDVDEGDVPGNSTTDMMKNMMGVALQKVFEMVVGGGGMASPGKLPPSGARPVSPTPQPKTPNPSTAPSQDDVDDEVDEEDNDNEENEDTDETESQEVESQEPEQELDPMQEIPRVASFFEYLKGAIESKTVTYEEAANEANLRLSPPIVDFLKQVDDSSLIINQLQPLLMSVCGPVLTSFYFEATTVEWMNKMLMVMRGEVVVEKVETVQPQEKAPKPEVKETSQAAPEASKTENSAAKPESKRKKKSKASDPSNS
jgi:hypothetical protein